jgi:hypothetical protein
MENGIFLLRLLDNMTKTWYNKPSDFSGGGEMLAARCVAVAQKGGQARPNQEYLRVDVGVLPLILYQNGG